LRGKHGLSRKGFLHSFAFLFFCPFFCGVNMEGNLGRVFRVWALEFRV
jgi:hypothetical protein